MQEVSDIRDLDEVQALKDKNEELLENIEKLERFVQEYMDQMEQLQRDLQETTDALTHIASIADRLV